MAAFFVIVTLTFLVVPLIPGDPAVQIAGSQATTTEVERIRSELGLDQPLWQQYIDYLGAILAGDLGTSFRFNQPVADIIFPQLGYTAVLALGAMAVVLGVSIPLGTAVAMVTRSGRHPKIDTIFGVATGLFSTIPTYVLGTVLVVVFANQLKWVPPSYSSFHPASSAILPIFALSLGATCTMARVVRREAIKTLDQDFMRTARGWRIPGRVQVVRYLLPNIMTATLTLAGLVMTALLGGAVIVETVFAWPGLGTAVVSAVATRDYPMIQGLVLMLGMLAWLVTALVDALLGVIDPRTLGGKNAT